MAETLDARIEGPHRDERPEIGRMLEYVTQHDFPDCRLFEPDRRLPQVQHSRSGDVAVRPDWPGPGPKQEVRR